MADILGATNPVPGYDKSVTNRNVPVSSENNARLQNVPDTTRISRADGRTERQGNELQNGGNIRYDSSFQTFVQRLRETPDLATTLKTILSGSAGTVVLSGMKEGVATEMAQLLQMMQMDEKQLLNFLTGQAKLGSRFTGPLFTVLRSAFARTSSEMVQTQILQFLKTYANYSSAGHTERSILQNLRQMADAMPASWAENLRQMLAQLENTFASGDRQGGIQLLQRNIFPHMSSYVEQTHDMGLPRQLLTMLSLDLARYENGTEQRLLEDFHQLRGYAGLKDTLGGIDDQALLSILQRDGNGTQSAARFADALVSAANHALRGSAGPEMQQNFQNLLASLLINESVYMPLNHYLLPLQWEDRMLFSELWVDPDADSEAGGGSTGEKSRRFLLKIDVQELGLFDVVLSSRRDDVELLVAYPEKVAPFADQIQKAVTQILVQNALTPVKVEVRKMERPVTLTEVFPKIFERRDGVNVKV